MNAPELPIGTVLKRNPAATSTPSPKAEDVEPNVKGPGIQYTSLREPQMEMKRVERGLDAAQPTIAETDLWLNYSCAALTGLLARPNTQFTKEQLAVTACEYADLMAEGFRKRFVQ